MPSKKIMKRINIFLNKEERQVLEHIKKVHSLSFSTITDIIVRTYWTFDPYVKAIKEYSNSIQWLTKKRNKTSIKLKNIWQLTDREINCALLFYIYKMDLNLKDKYLTDKEMKKIYDVSRKAINKEFQTTIDNWANYNAFCRMKERYQRENEA